MIDHIVVELLTNSLFAVFMFRTLQISKLSPPKKETDQLDIVSIQDLDAVGTVIQALTVSTECFVYV